MPLRLRSAVVERLALRLSLLGSPEALCDGEPLTVDTRKATALLAYLAVERRRARPRLARRAPLARVRARPRARGAAADALDAALGARRTLARRRARRGLARAGRRPARRRRVPAARRRRRPRASSSRPRRSIAASFLAGFGLRDSAPFDDWQSLQAGTLARELGGGARPPRRGARRAREPRARDRARAPPAGARSAERGGPPPADRALRRERRAGRRARAVPRVRPHPAPRARRRADRGDDRRLPRGPRGSRARRRPSRPRPPAPAGAGRSSRSSAASGSGRRCATRTRAVGPDGRLVVLEGETGIGKTRLAERARRVGARRGRGRGVRPLRRGGGRARVRLRDRARARRPARRRLRRGVCRLPPPRRRGSLPELGTPPAPALDGPGAQARFLDGVSRTLLEAIGGDRPGVLVVDDAHWADASSLEVLAFLARRLAGRPLLLVLTWRSEEAPPAHPARRILAERRARGAGSHDRARPARPRRRRRARGGGGRGAGARGAAVRGDRGRAVLRRRVPRRAAGRGRRRTLPPGVRGLVESRIAGGERGGGAGARRRGRARPPLRRRPRARGERPQRGGDRGRARGADAPRAARRGGRRRRTRSGTSRRGGWPTTSTSSAAAGCSIARAADALAARDRSGASAGAIAQHLRAAGREAEAAEWFRLAGVHARSLYANAEALAHFREALGLGHEDPGALHEEIGDLLTLGGRLRRRARRATRRRPRSRRRSASRSIAHRTGLVHHRRGEWELAESSFVEALAALPEDATALEARLLADRSLTAHRLGGRRGAGARRARRWSSPTRPATAARRRRRTTSSASSPPAAATHAEARVQLERASRSRARSDDPSARAAALNNLALALRAEGELDRALELTEEALELCAAVGDRHREAALANNLADLLNASGRREEAMDHLKSAVAIFAEIGEGGADRTSEPEIWKLVEW